MKIWSRLVVGNVFSKLVQPLQLPLNISRNETFSMKLSRELGLAPMVCSPSTTKEFGDRNNAAFVGVKGKSYSKFGVWVITPRCALNPIQMSLSNFNVLFSLLITHNILSI